MATDKIKALTGKPLDAPVYYFASTEADLLHEAAAVVRNALLAAGDCDAEATRVDGPAPDMGELAAAAGAVSFFGTRRVVEVAELTPSSLSDKDAKELAELFGELSSAVLVVTALYKDKKAATSKKSKLLFDAAASAGVAMELAKPSRRELVSHIEETAAAIGARYAPGGAEALLDRAGDNRALLRCETEKLAAIAGYDVISREMVDRYSTHNIEADVFELVRYITAGNKAAAYNKLAELLSLRHEPIAITAALAGTFVDMFRVRTGIEAKKNVGTIFKDMGYKGSDYRLQKALENAKKYTAARLRQCILCLYGLDRQLKSSALPDKSLLLTAAVGELLLAGGRA